MTDTAIRFHVFRACFLALAMMLVSLRAAAQGMEQRAKSEDSIAFSGSVESRRNKREAQGDTLSRSPLQAPPLLSAPALSPQWMMPSYSLPLPKALAAAETERLDTRAVQESIRQSWQAPKPYLLRWDQGKLTGFNGIENYPLLGSNATAGLGAVPRFDDRWTLVGTAAVSHLVIPYFTENTAITSAQLSYQANDNISFSVFGTYRTPSFMSSMANPAAWQYGGYMTLQTDNHLWGVDMGARREYNPYTGRVESVPILMPYYNLQGQKLGFDFGGVLKSIFINQQMKRSLHSAGGPAPAPGPPQGTKPAWLR